MEYESSILNPKEFMNKIKDIKILKDSVRGCPISGLLLHDIKTKDRRSEDDLYLNNDFVFETVRRGNCLIESKGNFFFGRKGLIKFFDYKLDFENDKLSNKDRKIYKRIMKSIIDSFHDNKHIYIYQSEKVNGENFQVSFSDEFNSWIIGSKNVSIMVVDRKQIKFYENTKDNKYNFVIKFAYTWFDILDILLKNFKLEQFVNDISGYTLVGENVGDEDSQHIKYYPSKDIIFFAMVSNNSKYICESFEYSYSIFNKYGLSCCKYNVIGPVKTISDFYKAMNEIYVNVLKSSVEKEGEGSVAYICSAENTDEKQRKIISICKLKTFEYRIFRKIRENLKLMISRNESDVNKYCKKIEKDIEELLGAESEKVNKTCYLNLARYIFNNYDKYISKYNIYSQFALFLKDILIDFEKEYKIKVHPFTENKTEKEIELDLKSSIVDILNIGIQEYNPNKESNNELKIKTYLNEKINLEVKEKLSFDNKLMNYRLFVLLIFGLPGCGKTTIYRILKEVCGELSKDINLFRASSDEFRGKLIDEFLLDHSNSNFEEAFQRTSKDIGKRFMNYTLSTIDNCYLEGKINIIYYDKNINPETINNTKSSIYKHCKKKMIKTEFILFYPKTEQPIKSIKNKDFVYPFSWPYLIQCYFRIKYRKDHETLDISKNKNFSQILLIFLNLFKNYDFKELKIGDNSISKEISFVEEKSIEISEKMCDLLEGIQNNVLKASNNSKCNKVKALFELIENAFKPEDFKSTEEEIKKEMKESKNMFKIVFLEIFYQNKGH